MSRTFSPYKEGNVTVLFDSRMLPSAEQIVISAEPSGKALVLPWRKIGFAFLALSFLGFFVLGFPMIISELSYQLLRLSNGSQIKAEEKTFADFLDERQRSKNSQEFSVRINKLGIQAKIIPNVDAANPLEYGPALMQGVAHAKGTSFPGEGGLIYLFAHSTNYAFNTTRYNALFYNLKEMEIGDKIVINFQGKNFTYKTVEKKIVNDNDFSDFKNNNGEKLILQTCWPPGTTWKRLLVIAQPIRG